MAEVGGVQEGVPSETYTIGQRLWTKRPDTHVWIHCEVTHLTVAGDPRFNECSERDETRFTVVRELPVQVGQDLWVAEFAEPWAKAQVTGRHGHHLEVHIEGGPGKRRIPLHGLISTAADPPPRPYTAEMACYAPKDGWADMLAITGKSQKRAFAEATLRLLLWHLAQPIWYFVLLAVHASHVDRVQFWLGIAVGIREAIYVLVTLTGVVVRPTFLVIDVMATVRQAPDGNTNYMLGLPFLSLYVASPDKTIVTVLALALGHSTIPWVFAVFSGIFDLCGVAALSAGFASGVHTVG